MANRLQLRRGDGNPGSIFYEGEPIYDRTGEVLYVGDTGANGTGAGSSIASNIAYETVLEMLRRTSNGTAGQLRIYEDTAAGSDFVTLTSPNLAASYTLTLPQNDGDTGQVVRTDGSGVLSFVDLLNLAADYGTTDAVLANATVTFAGTANEIFTTVTDNQIQVGLETNLSVAGNLVVNNNLNVTGLSTFASNVDINASADISGDLVIQDALNVTGLSTFASNVDINASADISGDLVIQDALNVTGLSTFGSAVDINGSVDISDDLVVNDALNVTGLSTFGSAVDINASVDVSADLVVNNNLNVTGLSTFADDVDINASVDISNGLNVTGFTTIANNVDINAALEVTGISTFGSNVDINASVDVSADLVVNNNLNVTGFTTIGNNVDVNAALEVTGISTFGSNVDINASVDVSADLVVNNNLNVTGLTTLTGLVQVDTGIVPDADEGAYLGTSALPFLEAYVDEIIIGATDNTVTTATGNLILDSAGGTVDVQDNLTVSVDLTVTGTTTLNGNTTIGDDPSDTIAFTGRASSDFVPVTDSVHDLGVTTSRWAEIWGDALTIDNIQIGVSGDNEIDTTTGNLTLDSATGEVVVDDNLTITGNLTVVGTAVTFETESVRVEDRLLELGLINNAAPASLTTWDSGIVFNYNNGAALKAGVIWFENSGDYYIGFATTLNETNPGGGSDVQDPQVNITGYAPIVADSLYLGGINAADLVINSDNEAVNLIFDGGSY